MNGNEYLVWILLTGWCCFAAARLYWIYKPHPYHLFWQRPGARQYIFIAVLLAFAALATIFMRWPAIYLLPPGLAFYLLCAFAAVKISERGIFANARMARWLDIVAAQRLPAKNHYLILTNKPWLRLRLETPAALDAQFRKMLALQKIPLLPQEEPASASRPLDQTLPPRQSPAQLNIDNPAGDVYIARTEK